MRTVVRAMSAALLVGAAAWASDVYVAPDGKDANLGTKEKPFATLTRARDAARQLGSNRVRRIVARGGKYYDVSLVLGPEDSGLTIEAAPGETPVLHGGRPVKGWAQDEGKFCSVALPGVKEGKWDFRHLIVNGQFRPRARLPKEGRFRQRNPPWTLGPKAELGGGYTNLGTDAERSVMRYVTGDLGPWFDAKNAELTIFHQWDDSCVGVKAIDFATQTMTFSAPAAYVPGSFNETYVIWNLREGMSEPGQWYLDRTAGRLVYWLMPGEDVAGLEALVPTQESVIRIVGETDRRVTGITLKNLAIRCTTTPLKTGGWAGASYGGAVDGDWTRDCRLLGLVISAVGGQGVWLRNSDNPLAEGCEVSATGSGGIYFWGNGGEIRGNHVHHIGQTCYGGFGIRVGSGANSNHVIRHNDVHDTSYSGMEINSSNTLIEYNKLYNCMQVLNDGGSIYTSAAGGLCRNTVLRRNVAYYNDKSEKKPWLMGYYLDEGSTECVIEENVAVNAAGPHLNQTKDCTVRNNLFLDSGTAEAYFVDWQKGNFNLRTTAPALPQGVTPWDYQAAGQQEGQR
jgi:hypothetical protein